MRQLKITKQVTNRQSVSFDKYLQEISKLPMITADEEVELARLIKAGDEQALNTLVNANLRFVVSVAKQYQNQELHLIDLINEGNIGLVKAAKRFDETRGFKFISYAVWWIRQSILQALAQHSRIIRLPLNRIGNLNKINKAYSRLEQEKERPPSTEELAEVSDMTVSNVKQAIRNSGRHLSMDAPLKEGEVSNLYDIVTAPSPSPDSVLIKESLNKEIIGILDILHPTESKVLRLFYGIGIDKPISLSEIAETFDLTQERVRQIKAKAILRLQKTTKKEALRKYLG